MAEAIGILGIRIKDPADLEQAIYRVLAHRGPALLDVLTNPQELAMLPKATFEQAYGFGLFIFKAVPSGRGSEVAELAKSNIFR
jgi:pyruvate dehydrogenase (quinone)